MLNRKGTIETLVVSIAGTPPTDQDWDQLFTRMAGTCTSYVTPSVLCVELHGAGQILMINNKHPKTTCTTNTRYPCLDVHLYLILMASYLLP